jgi:hypothetical protein
LAKLVKDPWRSSRVSLSDSLSIASGAILSRQLSDSQANPCCAVAHIIALTDPGSAGLA